MKRLRIIERGWFNQKVKKLDMFEINLKNAYRKDGSFVSAVQKILQSALIKPNTNIELIIIDN